MVCGNTIIPVCTGDFINSCKQIVESSIVSFKCIQCKPPWKCKMKTQSSAAWTNPKRVPFLTHQHPIISLDMMESFCHITLLVGFCAGLQALLVRESLGLLSTPFSLADLHWLRWWVALSSGCPREASFKVIKHPRPHHLHLSNIHSLACSEV